MSVWCGCCCVLWNLPCATQVGCCWVVTVACVWWGSLPGSLCLCAWLDGVWVGVVMSARFWLGCLSVVSLVWWLFVCDVASLGMLIQFHLSVLRFVLFVSCLTVLSVVLQCCLWSFYCLIQFAFCWLVGYIVASFVLVFLFWLGLGVGLVIWYRFGVVMVSSAGAWLICLCHLVVHSLVGGLSVL